MSDLERVARAIAKASGQDFDTMIWSETDIAAAMRETRLIDAEAARKAERQSRKGGMLAGLWKGRADWLQSRAGDENDC